MRAALRRAAAGPRASRAATRRPGRGRTWSASAGAPRDRPGPRRRAWRHRPGQAPTAAVRGPTPIQREVAERVVFDQERAGRAHRLEHGGAALGRERRPVRVGEQRLAVEHSRARLRERVGQQVGADAVLVAGYRAPACRPAARAATSAPRYVGDSTRTGAPGSASPRRHATSAAWPPGQMSTSPALAPPPTAAAKYVRSEARPSSGIRSHAPGRRAARASACPSAPSGCSSAGR